MKDYLCMRTKICENAQAPYGNIVSIVNLHLNKIAYYLIRYFKKRPPLSHSEIQDWGPKIIISNYL